ncbi:MAG: tetratricopeptide repeat protein [Deltaproteobacteria bacterium]|nr:tetratricopeptide repeat protein [Deltaproteobacteria bacterium]
MAVQREKLVRNAEKFVSRGRIEAAIREYRKILADQPKDTGTLNRVGDLYARINRIDEAVRLFTQIAEQYTDEGFFVKAIAIYKKIIKLDPTRLSVYEKLAELYHKQGLVNEARTQYQVLADYYLKHDNAASAISIYQNMAELEPDDPAHRVKLAELYQQEKLVDKAMGQYQLIADIMLEHGRVEKAVQVLERGLELDPDDLDFLASAVDKLQAAGANEATRDFLTSVAAQNPAAEGLLKSLASEEEEQTPEEESVEPVVEPTFEHEELTELESADLSQATAAAATELPRPSEGQGEYESLYGISEEPSLESEVAEPTADTTYLGPDTVMQEALAAAEAFVGTEEPDELSASENLEDLGGELVLGWDEDEADSLIRPPQDMLDKGPDVAGSGFQAEEDEADGQVEVAESLTGSWELDLEELGLTDLDSGEEQEPRAEATPTQEVAPTLEVEPVPEAEQDVEGEENAFAVELEDGESPLPEESLEDVSEPDDSVLEIDSEVSFDLEPVQPDADLLLKIEEGHPRGTEASPEPTSSEPLVPEALVLEDPASAGGVVEEGSDAAELIIGTELLEDEALETTASGDTVLHEAEADAAAEEPSAPLEELELVELELDFETEFPELAEIDADAGGGEDASVATPLPPKPEDMLSEAEVLAKYGLRPKAFERVGELLELDPDHLGGHRLLIQLHLDEGNEDQVRSLAKKLADLSKKADEPAEWKAAKTLLSEAGFALEEGEPVPAKPKKKKRQTSDRIDRLLASLLEEAPSPKRKPPISRETEQSLEDRPDPLPEPSGQPSQAPDSTEGELVEASSREGEEPEAIPAAKVEPELASQDGAEPELEPISGETPSSSEPSVVEVVVAGPADQGEEDSSVQEDHSDIEDALAGMKPLEKMPALVPTQEAGASWLDEVEAQREAQPAPEELFDDEEEFFDLAAELEEELTVSDAIGTQPAAEQSLEEIVEGFKKGVEDQLSPEDYDTHLDLGIAYREMGLLDEAIGEFQVAAKADHLMPTCCSMLGICFLDKGLPELAIKWYTRGLAAPAASEEDSLALLYDLGDVYLSMGDLENSKKTFVEVYGINSNYRDIVAKLAEAKGQ